MSLVIARKIICPELSIIILGDTRLSDTEGNYISPDRGVIKTNIINEKLCISWVGNSYWADRFFKKNNKFLCIASREEVLKCIENFCKQFCINRDIDFIVCFGRTINSGDEIVSIKDGEIIRNCSKAWIGSLKAYKEFSLKYNAYAEDYEQRTNQKVSGTLEKHMVMQSMREIIMDQKDITVGDFLYQISYLLSKQQFKFDSGYIIKPNAAQKKFSVGSARDGDYSICYAADPKNKYLALLFYQSQCIWIWGAPHGGYMKIIEKIPCISIPKCEQYLKDKYKIEMKMDLFMEFETDNIFN